MRSIRSRQRFIVAGVVALGLTLAVAGCGGGAGTTTTAVTAPPSAGPATTVAPGVARNPLIGQPLTSTENTPAEVTDALSQHRPLVILFYVPGGADDGAVLDEIKALQSKYRDVTFILYDFKDPNSYGDLGILLRVDYPPQSVFVDTQGLVFDVRTGFVDAGTLNQQVVNIRQG